MCFDVDLCMRQSGMLLTLQPQPTELRAIFLCFLLTVPIIEFSAREYHGSENVSNLTVTLKRSGDMLRSLSVTINIENIGNATDVGKQ